mmetsp:Transcript_22559/g.51658  ORF Transcript_22559/g.51658 Transcript_22559/m.51658 type:complete len:223 (-) Transcript_22559:2734-3402(-)
MHFIVHQMLQSLIKSGPQKNSSAQGLARVSLIHGFISMFLITHGMQPFTDIFYRDICKRSCITFHTLEHHHLPQQTFDQLSDGHSGGDGMGVDNDIRNDAFRGEGHVFLAVGHTDGSLLSVTRSKFISNLWNTRISDSDLRKSISLLRGGNHNVVHNTIVRTFHWGTAVPFGIPTGHNRISLQGGCLSNENVFSADAGARLHESVLVQLAILAMFHAAAVVM